MIIMFNRLTLTLYLDVAMLLLVCVLEAVALTGLNLHEWLGFVLCPLVLLHVVINWSWCVAQVRRIRSAGKSRIGWNAWLNLSLLIMMSAVLVSGILVSTQVTSILGEPFGRVRLWSTIHGGFNIILLGLVGLHLALNWDWLRAAMKRRSRQAVPANAQAPLADNSVDYSAVPRAGSRWSNGFRRGSVILLIALVSAFACYAFMWAINVGPEKTIAALYGASGDEPAPRQGPIRPAPHPVDLPHGLEQLTVTCVGVGLAVLIGKYVFRLKL
jgi:hypothetical protein